MKYAAVLSNRAKADILKMPPAIREYTLSQLKALELNPTLLSKPSHFPYRENCQMFTFDKDHEGKRHFITVLFQYGTDEATLYVAGIAYQAADDWWGK